VCGTATAAILTTGWSKIIAVSKAAAVRCVDSRARDRLAAFCRAYDELRNFLRPRSRTHQQVSADDRRFHFRGHTATVLRLLEAAWKISTSIRPAILAGASADRTKGRAHNVSNQRIKFVYGVQRGRSEAVR
jgi:hypothetical protein